jgi:hypothetical protein
MSSIHSYTAQPKTRKFVNTQSYSSDSANPEYGPYLFSQSAIDSFVSANSNVSKIGSVITITGNFVDTLNNNGSNELLSFGQFNERKTMTDMGATVYIGNGVQSELLVLRLVQLPANAADCNSALDAYKTAYIVVENNCSDLGGDRGRFMVRAARV